MDMDFVVMSAMMRHTPVDQCFESDPDPERKKIPTKIEKVLKFDVLKCWMFFFEG
jgi:hypothetical protein